MSVDATRVVQLGREVIETEARAVLELGKRMDTDFVRACKMIYACSGRTVVTGMGKSGHIAGKVAATLASTGTPAFFLHPGEAGHGDMGMITAGDVVLAFSNSGETEEINALLPGIKRQSIPLIAVTGAPGSTLARQAGVHINVSVSREACPLGLAPTASTTAALAMGDALALALMECRGFSAEDFARGHPRGRLGRRLLLRVADVMRTGADIPLVPAGSRLPEALVEMTSKGLGATLVRGADGALVGIFTDGDLRRALDSDTDIRTLDIDKVMTGEFKSVAANALAVEALELMEQHRITVLPVTNRHGLPEGIITMHLLLQHKVV